MDHLCVGNSEALPSKSLFAALYEKYDDSALEQEDGFCEIFVPTKALGKIGRPRVFHSLFASILEC